MPPFLVVDSSIFRLVTRALECAEKRDVIDVHACAAVLLQALGSTRPWTKNWVDNQELADLEPPIGRTQDY
jgi:hypothetical protein